MTEPSIIIILFALGVAIAAFVRAFLDRATYQKEIERLSSEIQKAQRILQKKSNLANEVAHELKNPLTAILCSAEALEMLIGNKVEEEHRKTLKYMREYGNILLRLVTDFLDLNRAEGGNLTTNPEAIRVCPAIHSIIGLLKARAYEKDVALEFITDDPEIETFADSAHFKQIIFNLVYNAIKYTSSGGEVSVRVRKAKQDEFLTIEVADTGSGISPDQLEHIFDPYARFQNDSNESALDIGVGLGLGLCKTLVENSDGSISVESELGVGSIFSVRLPCIIDLTRPAMLPPLGVNEQPLLGLRFLLIDENLGSRETIAQLIKAWGGMVDQVTLAQEALDAIQSMQYDAVMIDDSVQTLDTFELTRRIKCCHPGGNAAVIFTGREPEDLELAREAGADSFVAKPFNGNTLLESLIPRQERH
ncbi:MAG: response regulator [Bdellovibrionales bacterium]|nr:response regulator [Bdellovibrionales bacterium]